MIRGQVGQVVGAQMISATTGDPFIGTVTVYVTGDDGAQVIGSVSGGLATDKGNGYYTYDPAAVETAFDLAAYTFVGVGAVPVTIQIQTITASQALTLQATGPSAVSGLDLVTDALTEIRMARAGDALEPSAAEYALRLLNRLLDSWNAENRAAYADTFVDFTLIPNHSPHTLGPGGDFDVTQRPVRVDSVAINLGGSPAVLIEIDVHRDSEWYQQQPVPGMVNSFPTDVYSDTAWPLGNLYFWGVPSIAYGVRIWMRLVLAELALADTVSLPPGYREAIGLTLSESCAPGFGQTVSPSTERRARDARALIFANNDVIPNARTRDGGMPGARGGGFDFRTGFLR